MNLKGGAVIFGTGKLSLTWQVEVYVRRRRGGDAGSVVIQSRIATPTFLSAGSVISIIRPRYYGLCTVFKYCTPCIVQLENLKFESCLVIS